MILLLLFWSFFKTGLFSIGGGYAMIPLIAKNMAEYGWMTQVEIADMVAISQMTPGPFAVNTATFVGMRMAGFGGACVATLGVTLPSVLLVLIIARFFQSFQKKRPVQSVLYGVRPAVTALIAASAWGILQSTMLRGGWEAALVSRPAFFGQVDLVAVLLFAAVFTVMLKWKADPILMIGLSGAAGMILYGFLGIL